MQQPRQPYRRQQAVPKRQQSRRLSPLALCAIATVVVLLFTHILSASTTAAIPEVQSGVTGYCLSSQSSVNGSVLDTQPCNNSTLQKWTVGLTAIQQTGNRCLEVAGSKTAPGSRVDIGTCSNQPDQVWLRDKNGFINPNSQLCLALPNGKTGQQLVLSPCGQLDRLSEQWYAIDPANEQTAAACPSTEGARVACFAIREWTAWQANPASRNTLLARYTDNASYEEWCADFISYVYKEAGYPFANAPVDGWDENDANKLQDMGFTMHDPATYTPLAGDVAYFSYDGGHVEIVVAGGPHPTFIYGNSGDVDPITGNGTMKANTITDDGSNGRLIYYLSPNPA